MKLSNLILLIGSIIAFYFAYKWYSTNDASYEPIVTISSSILTVIGYIIALKYSDENSKNINVDGDNNVVISDSKKNKINIKR